LRVGIIVNDRKKEKLDRIGGKDNIVVSRKWMRIEEMEKESVRKDST